MEHSEEIPVNQDTSDHPSSDTQLGFQYQPPSTSSSSNNNGDPDPETSDLGHGAVEKEKEEEVSGASIHQELARLELKENEEEPVLKPDLEEKKEEKEEEKEEEKDEEKVVDRDLSGEEMGSRNGSDDGNENVNEDGYGNGSENENENEDEDEDEDEDRKREVEENDDEDGGVGENKSGNETENGSEVNNGSGEMDKKNGYGGGIRKYQYPVRPEAEDCSFYLKTGTCKFGSNCKFNHPVRKRSNQGAKEKVKEREESTENPGQSECKYYLRSGGCKFGKACKYNHTRGKTSAAPLAPVLEFNFVGLPIRVGEKECPYYMRTGSCKYGGNCRFNHPDPTDAAGSDTSAGYGNGRPVSLQGARQSTLGSWSSPRSLNETAPFMPMMLSPTQGVPSQNPEWNGYQAPPVYLPERNLPPPPAYVMNNPVTETNMYQHHPPQKLIEEYPERPGQPECTFFLKTGDCKFKSNCKYHHPKKTAMGAPLCALSDKGLPLRPDQNICTYYSRYGICKFGPACKYDHPVQATPTMSGVENQPPPYSNMAGEGAGIARRSRSETQIQQLV